MSRLAELFLSVMSSEHRSFIEGLVAVVAALIIVSLAFASKLQGLVENKADVEEIALNRERIASVQDSFDWADGIITSLGQMAPELVPTPETPMKIHKPSLQQLVSQMRSNLRHRRHLFKGRHLCLQKSTVFGIFDVTIDEIGPELFSLHVGSTEPAENIQIRDRVSKSILVDQPLDDERLFVVQVHRKLSPKIAVSISVLQDGEINKAYFPLFGGNNSN
jgi:hypothetical protein